MNLFDKEERLNEEVENVCDNDKACCDEEDCGCEDDYDEVGMMMGFPLLGVNYWHQARFKEDFRKMWGIEIKAEEAPEDLDPEIAADQLIFHVDDMTVAIEFINKPIPEHEAELASKNNYRWPEATIVAHKHIAHLAVHVFGTGTAVERGELFVKVMSSIAMNDSVTGLYTLGTVFEPAEYRDTAWILKQKRFPILNLVWFGLYPDKDGFSGYTVGMNEFGKFDLEMIGSGKEPTQIYAAMADIATHLIIEGVDLTQTNEVFMPRVGKFKLKSSRAVAIPGFSMKITQIAPPTESIDDFVVEKPAN